MTCSRTSPSNRLRTLPRPIRMAAAATLRPEGGTPSDGGGTAGLVGDGGVSLTRSLQPQQAGNLKQGLDPRNGLGQLAVLTWKKREPPVLTVEEDGSNANR